MRRGEAASLRWSDIGPDRIVLGAAETKGGLEHSIFLSDLMRAALAAQPRTPSRLVFPLLVNGQRIRD